VDINRAWETIRENIRIPAKESLGYYGLKKHKPWFDKRCSKLLDKREQANLQWLQGQSQINGNNLNNIRCEVILGIKGGNIWNTKLMSLQFTVTARTLRNLYRGIS
jgi:hypothetical protein